MTSVAARTTRNPYQQEAGNHVSYTISITGHISEPEAAGPTGVQNAAQVEAELAVKLHELLSQPKYGCITATLYGRFGSSGSVDLIATTQPPADGGGETEASTSP